MVKTIILLEKKKVSVFLEFEYFKSLKGFISESVSSFNELDKSFDLLISLQMVAANPIKGIGFGSEVYKNIQEQSQIFLESDILEGRGNTNSIVYIFVVI